MPCRIVFMGSPEFAVPALATLVDAMPDVTVVGVVTQPDRPAGRGRKLQPPPVKRFAVARGLNVYQPVKVRNGELRRWLADLDADVAVVAAYGRVLPQVVLDTPRLGCVNLHASLLPRWRGASPIQRAIAAGDTDAGVCLMQMDPGLDTGAELARVVTPILASDTAESLSERLAADAAKLLMRSLPALLAGSLDAQPQPDDGVTLARLLTKRDGQIDWQRSAQQVHAQIRAMTPWPGAWTTLSDAPDETWKVFPTDMHCVGQDGAPAGTVVAIKGEQVTIACGRDALVLHELQRPGRRRMGAGSALRGARLVVGTSFTVDAPVHGA